MIQTDVPLAALSTLMLGGAARYFLHAADADGADLCAGLRFARARGLPVAVLGGGSNVVIADAGFAGLVVHMAQRGVSVSRPGAPSDPVLVTAQAGEPWDELVARTVAEGLAGLECLSGIPGRCGATPIQNVGAYGQEVSETLFSVHALDRRTLEPRDLSPAECAFGYRDSRFKQHPDDYVVLAVTFALRPANLFPPALRYPELVQALPDPAPPLAGVRDTVLALRRRKSMVIDPLDENRRSVGSFFMNPVLPDAQARQVMERAAALGLCRDPAQVPHYPAGPGSTRIKLAAGWLIEKAGIRKGQRLPGAHVGVSSRHALALVHHGGGTSAELLELARRVRDAVEERFGVTLRPEPVFLGFPQPPL